jgi:hypothetical protein
MAHKQGHASGPPLLENAEQNIGNSQILVPQASAVVNPDDNAVATWNVGTVLPQTTTERILNLEGGSNRGQTTSIIFTVSRILQGAQNPNPGFPGPVTGIIEYGNGGRSTRLEFDLVVGPFAGSINQAVSAIEPQDGTVVVTVPTGVLRAYARYDNLLLAPILGTNPPMSLVQWINYNNSLLPHPPAFIPVFGPGGPIVCDNPSGGSKLVIPAEPVLVKAMANYFGKPRSRVYKTLNCYVTPETGFSDTHNSPALILVGSPPASEIGGYTGYAFWALPAFTKSVKILRFKNTSGNAALNILLHDGVRPIDFIQIAAGDNSPPEIEIMGNESIIGIQSNSSNDTVSMLKIVCEIGI